jgi:hypothetical protein
LDSYEHPGVTGEPVDLVLVYTTLTVDIITEYAFARFMDNLDRPD